MVSESCASKPASSHIADASRHERSCDSSGWPNALSWASANVAMNSPSRRGRPEMGKPPDARVHDETAGSTYTPRHNQTIKENGNDPGNHQGGELRAFPRDLLDEGCREARSARLQGRNGVP